jgi:hypothetical protein
MEGEQTTPQAAPHITPSAQKGQQGEQNTMLSSKGIKKR